MSALRSRVEPSSINIENHFKSIANDPAREKCANCRQTGHSDLYCRVGTDHLKSFCNQETSKSKSCLENINKCTLVGSTNEVSVTIDNYQTTARVDTGSLISTICQSFYAKNLYNIPLQSLSNIFHVECADGQSLPSLGYIQCSLKAKGIDNNQVFVDGLFLIVPNTSYNKCVPVLIGSNIISVLMNLVKESHGLRYLQEAHFFAPWHLAFRCVSLGDKELQRHKNALALVRLAELLFP